jgi:VIT1/CCC1 family predicted Fe2+/Mn2+ transporter
MKTLKKKYNWLPDFVYGSIDGVVTTFAVVSGVQGASLSTTIILILGFANLFGDGFSMAVGKYLSDKAQLDHLKNEGRDDDSVNPLKGGWYTFLSFNLLGLIPLMGYIIGPFLGLNDDSTFVLTCIATMLALFSIGIVKGQVVNTSRIFAGFQTMMIGGIAAVIAYYVGFYIEKLV